MIVGIVIGLIVLISLIIGIVFYLRHRANKVRSKENSKESQNEIELKSPKTISGTLIKIDLLFFFFSKNYDLKHQIIKYSRQITSYEKII